MRSKILIRYLDKEFLANFDLKNTFFICLYVRERGFFAETSIYLLGKQKFGNDNDEARGKCQENLVAQLEMEPHAPLPPNAHGEMGWEVRRLTRLARDAHACGK